MRRHLIGWLGVSLAASLIGATPAGAQSEPAKRPGPIQFLDVDGVTQQLDLLVGKARILKLDTDVRDVLVAEPAIADVIIRTPRLIYVLGRQVGDTNVFFFDHEGDEIASLNARVEMDLSALRSALEKFMPNEGIRASSVNENIILTGMVGSAEVAANATNLARRFVESDANILNMLDIKADQQVVLRVRIAEMQRSAIKRLGLNLNFAKRGLNNWTSVGFTLAEAIAAPAGSVAANFLTTDTTFSAFIDALERNGLTKTLAEPNLTALSGETANFLAGGEFPIVVPQEEGVFTIEFKPFGIGLEFTPVVLSSGRISLRVQTEVSTIDFSVAAGGFPGVATRRAATTLELPSGGSLVIAGLLEDGVGETIEGLPGLKDIPVLGALFRSVNFRRNETELVIAVTVHLVRPVDEQQIVLPTDGFAPASDIDMYLFGRLHAVYARAEGVPPLAGLKAPAGYIME